jgi:hypothetical protein
VGNVHVVGGWGKILQLLLGKDIFSDKMDLCVSVLSGLGSRHVDDLARTALDDDVSTLPQGRTLHRVSQGCTGIGRVDGVIMLKQKLVSKNDLSSLRCHIDRKYANSQC